jgi:diguanylate cyclase (GGDEF)-like protein
MRILIAEDDSLSRLILQKYVAKLGHEVLVACDGGEAWARCQAEPVDVVITGWMMPGLDGPALCRHIRAGWPGQAGYVYVMLLTSLADRQHVLDGLKAGADDYLAKPLDQEELQVRLIAAERVTGLHRRLAEQKADLERLNEKLFDQGRTDALTRLPNRLRMQEDLAKVQDQCMRYGHRYVAALVDIDCYKKFNDRYGHLEGDRVLVAVADALRSCSRTSDAVYRYGGEEFLVLLPEQDLDQARQAMERRRLAVRELAIPHEGNAPGVVTISAGLAMLAPYQDKATDQVLREADGALYQAKEGGRDRVVVHPPPRPAAYVRLDISKCKA